MFKNFLKKHVKLQKKDNLYLSPSQSQKSIFSKAPLKMSNVKFANIDDAINWQIKSRKKLIELLQIDIETEYSVIIDKTEYIQENIIKNTFYLNTNKYRSIPVTLIINSKIDCTKPVLIYLSGMNTGIHLSWGETKNRLDKKKIKLYNYDIAIKAANLGWAVICIEQFGYGLREEKIRVSKNFVNNTGNEFSAGILVGRSLVGERVQDIVNTLKWLEINRNNFNFLKKLNLDKLTILGHSSGGTTAIYASAIESRIRACIASGCIGFIRDSLTERPNISGDAVVPSILNWFEINDIISMHAPNYFYAFAGKNDHIWPYTGLKNVMEKSKKTWEIFNKLKNIECRESFGGHRPYLDDTIYYLNKIIKSL